MTLPGRARLRPQPHELWWTGVPEAYLDLLYRVLPHSLSRRFATSPRVRSFRVWQPGHEDGSETFLLAAVIDEAIARLRLDRPEMAGCLDRIDVCIEATDPHVTLQRRGPHLRFGVRRAINAGPWAIKGPLTIGDFGAAARRLATSAVPRLETRLRATEDRARHRRLLKQLADAGKVGLLLERLLLRHHGRRTYRFADRRWRLEDRHNGGALNPNTRKRTIRFAADDIITKSARRRFDLVVCTNVLPHLPLYQPLYQPGGRAREDDLRRALRHIDRALGPGGTLIIDRGTASKSRWGQRFAATVSVALTELRARDVEVLITRSNGLHAL